MITPVLRSAIFFLILIWVSSVSASSVKNHPSPYLNMHANDPVKWQLWGKEVLDQARAENKMIFLSIGYFSCHWCHVMQRESYQDKAIGAFLNEHFIPVKVDRELRPELDRRMIQFVEDVSGRAGWPLNVFVTADGYPVTGFTYLPPDRFLKVLKQLDTEWGSRNEEIKRIARQYFEQSETSQSQSELVSLESQYYSRLSDGFVSQAMLLADELQGGFGETSKFPSYPQMKALINAIKLKPDIDADVIKFARLTLDAMKDRHLMDQVNDGFFRYTTDPDWQTPHFEKMLYDNAQLAQLYLDAELIWPDSGYRDIGLRTIDFMMRSLLDKDGGFNSSLSAVDEHNVEGGAYFWTREELAGLLSESELDYLSSQGVLVSETDTSFLMGALLKHSVSTENTPLVLVIQEKLRTAKKPIMPVDNKKIASWNALVLQALVKAQEHTADKSYQDQARRLYLYITANFIHRDAKTKTVSVNRFAAAPKVSETTLEDYAQLAYAIQLYALKNSSKSAQLLATELVQQTFARFEVDGRWLQNPSSLIPGDQGHLVIQDAVLESPVPILLQTVMIMPSPENTLKQKVEDRLLRLTKDVLEVPYHYGSSILAANSFIYNKTVSDKLTPK